MKLKLTLDDGTVRYTENVTKRKISGTLTSLKNKGVKIKGSARVTYSPNMYNEFDFAGQADFKEGYAVH